MEYIKSRNQFYKDLAKTIEEKTIKEKEKIENKVVKESVELYAPSNNTYIFESDVDDLKSLIIDPYSNSKIGDLVYIKKNNEPLITGIILITDNTANDKFVYDIIDSFEPAVEIDNIINLLRGE